jgi:hypothetical protein
LENVRDKRLDEAKKAKRRMAACKPPNPKVIPPTREATNQPSVESIPNRQAIPPAVVERPKPISRLTRENWI